MLCESCRWFTKHSMRLLIPISFECASENLQFGGRCTLTTWPYPSIQTRVGTLYTYAWAGYGGLGQSGRGHKLGLGLKVVLVGGLRRTVLGEWWRIVDGIDQSKASPLGFVRRRRSLQNLVQHNQRMTQTGENSHKPTSILHQRCVRWGIFLRIT